MQRGDQPRFEKIRQADLVEPDDRAQDGQHHEPQADAAPAETDAAFVPETGSHITGRWPEW